MESKELRGKTGGLTLREKLVAGVCGVCSKKCKKRGDGSVHYAEETVFCSCCVIWYAEEVEKATRTLDVAKVHDITLEPGELIRLVRGAKWVGFVNAWELFDQAEEAELCGVGGSGVLRFRGREVAVDLVDLVDAVRQNWEPPEGYCPLK